MRLTGMAPDDRLDLDHPRAGGVHHLESGCLQPMPGFRGNPVGPDQNRSLASYGDLVENRNPFFRQHFKHLGIVDQRPIGIDRSAVLLGGVEHHLDGPAHPHAETGRLGDEQFHQNAMAPGGDVRAGWFPRWVKTG